MLMSQAMDISLWTQYKFSVVLLTPVLVQAQASLNQEADAEN